MCFYALVQYEPDPDRQEGVNVGIVGVDAEGHADLLYLPKDERPVEGLEGALRSARTRLIRDFDHLREHWEKTGAARTEAIPKELQHWFGCESGALVYREIRSYHPEYSSLKDLYEKLVRRTNSVA